MKKSRLEWAKKMVNKPNEFWNTVLFSDESYINLFCGQPTYIRRPIFAKYSTIPDKYFRQIPKHPLSVMIWGCFSSAGTGRIKLVNGTMKSNNYLDVLENEMLSLALLTHCLEAHHLFTRMIRHHVMGQNLLKSGT